MIRSPTYKYFRKRPALAKNLTFYDLFKNLKFGIYPGKSFSDHILVVGPPRNGTTLVQKLLANHPRIADADTETFFFIKRRLDTVQVPEIPRETMRTLFLKSKTVAEYFDLIAGEIASDNQRFLEKSPEHALVMPKILKIFPNSKIIFIYRDGRDAYLSALRHPDIRAKIGQNYPHLWRDSMFALANLQHDERVYSLRYEDLCANPYTVLEDLFSHCGLAFSRELAEPSSYSRTKYAGRDEHKRLKEKISTQTVGIHQRPENSPYREYFESVSEDMLRFYRYID